MAGSPRHICGARIGVLLCNGHISKLTSSVCFICSCFHLSPSFFVGLYFFNDYMRVLEVNNKRPTRVPVLPGRDGFRLEHPCQRTSFKPAPCHVHTNDLVSLFWRCASPRITSERYSRVRNILTAEVNILITIGFSFSFKRRVSVTAWVRDKVRGALCHAHVRNCISRDPLIRVPVRMCQLKPRCEMYVGIASI